MSEQKSPEQDYAESIQAVVEALKIVPASNDVMVMLVNTWAQAKASELTTLNVVRQQLDDQKEQR